jgi:hypothetical protein
VTTKLASVLIQNISKLTVTAVEILIAVVVMAMKDRDGNNGRKRISGGSGGISGYGGDRQQEFAWAGNNQ